MNNTGEVREKNWQSVTKLSSVKIFIMQVAYFLNDPVLLYFIAILFYIERK